ncbi:MAG: hypothetical protein ABL911_11465 [Gallionella sp.]
MDFMLGAIDWIGCATGLLGAALLSMNNRYSGWGFVFFLVSNFAWMTFGLITHASSMVLMQIGFTGTSLIGVWKWLIVGRTASPK